MSTKKDTMDTSLEMGSEPKKRSSALRIEATMLRIPSGECIQGKGLDAKSIMERMRHCP